jgi:hypothetical protein
MEINPDKIPVEDKEAKSSFFSWSVKLATGAVGLFGLSGILYGLGFLVVRSHYSFLGIWGGIPLSDTEMIVEEGGRFFYHLLYALADPLLSPLVFVLLATALAWDLGKRFYHWGQKRLTRQDTDVLRKVALILPTVLVAAALAGTVLLLRTSWEIATWHDVLYSCTLECRRDNDYCLCVRDIDCLNDTYVKVVWGTLAGVVISWILYQQLWPWLGLIQRTLIAMQWLVVIAAVGIVPMAYGKLMLPLSYPSLNLPNAAPGETLLLAHTSSTWVVWNVQEKQTGILPRNDQEQVVIGQKKSIFALP